MTTAHLLLTITVKNILEHLKLRSSKCRRTFNLSPIIRRSKSHNRNSVDCSLPGADPRFFKGGGESVDFVKLGGVTFVDV